MRHMIILLALACVPASSYAQGSALRTYGAKTLGESRLEIGVGAAYRTRGEAPFAGAPLSLWQVPTVTARWGAAGNVDIEFNWSGRLLARYVGGSDGSDWGDPVIGTVVTVSEEGDALPALGLRTAVKLPSTSFLPYYLGSDQIDFFATLLGSRHIGPVEARMNIGLGILGNPRELGSQDDVYIASLAVLVSVGTRMRIFAEGYGMSGYKADDDKLLVQSGLTARFDAWQFSVFGGIRAAGTNGDFGAAFSASEEWSAGFSCSKEFAL